MKTKQFKSAAVLTVFRASDFSKPGKARIIKWLRNQANFLQHNSGKLAKRYTARYLYRNP